MINKLFPIYHSRDIVMYILLCVYYRNPLSLGHILYLRRAVRRIWKDSGQGEPPDKSEPKTPKVSDNGAYGYNCWIHAMGIYCRVCIQIVSPHSHSLHCRKKNQKSDSDDGDLFYTYSPASFIQLQAQLNE